MSAKDPPALTTTSYAVLGLLCVHQWSAYDLAQQMTRSTRFVWPRARSGVYNEPKKLVAHAYATVRTERTGRRERNVYRVTAKGRRAMASWLKSQTTAPQFESESLLRVWLLDQGSREDLLANISRLRDEALLAMEQVMELTAGYLERDKGPFPHRRHSHLLTARFALDYHAMLMRWASWAESEVATWPDLPPDDLAFLDDALRELRAQFEATEAEFGPFAF